jgi:L,D-peptidoglycan transpeptidase YkuD (ErfK/YbiS/YcfS/YnhG family)
VVHCNFSESLAQAACDDEGVRRSLSLLCAAVVIGTGTTSAPVSRAEGAPWFARSVGTANQVISVVGVGGSSAKMDVWQNNAAGWQPLEAGIPAHVGVNGLAPVTHEGDMATPMGVFSLDFAFGTAANPGTGLQYLQVGPDHWWDGDSASPTYNTMQVCKKAQCPFDTSGESGTENLDIPQYRHAVVMGVNKNRVPGGGSAFFVHSTDGGPTAGCVSIDDATLVQLMRWLRPGAVIAIAK